MGRGSSKKKPQRAAVVPRVAGQDASPERLAHSESKVVPALRVGQERMENARRMTPAIDTLLARQLITDAEHRALSFYRDQAIIAERSPLRSCLDHSVRISSGNGPTASITSAVLTVARIERDLGGLRDIARAVAIDDQSLSQWCVSRFGGRERYDGKGRFIAVIPRGEKRQLAMARMELRMAAQRIVA